MKKKIIHGEQARLKILEGVELLHSAIAHTLGPLGNNTVFSSNNSTPLITNDGVSIAREILVDDEAVNIGINLLKEAAIGANDIAGDGTTTSIVLSRELYIRGLKAINDGENPIKLRAGMLKALEEIKLNIDKYGRKVTTDKNILDIATISAGNRKMGEIILEAFKLVSGKGIVEIEKNIDKESYVSHIKGLHLNTKLEDEFFIRNLSKNCKELKLNDCLIFNTNLDFCNMKKLKNLIMIAHEKNVPCVVIGNHFDKEVVSQLLINAQRGVIVIPVVAPSFGGDRIDELKDVEAIIGAKLLEKKDNIPLDILTAEQFYSYLGKVPEIKIKKDILIFSKLNDDSKLEERIKELKENNYNKNKVAKLEGGIATIYVGGYSNVDVNETYLRVEDAVNATYSAIEEGYTIGGGNVLYKINSMEELKKKAELDKGYEIVLSSLVKPLETICENSGVVIENITKQLQESVFNDTLGLNAISHLVEDLLAVGVIDPIKTIKSSLTSAVLIVSSMLTTNCLVVDAEEKKNFKNFL